MSNIQNHPLISISEEILRPTRVEINLKHLAHNFKVLKQKTLPSKIMPILKANAYGHGLVTTARFFEKIGADYLGVAVLEEGILLREKGISLPILVLGGIIGNQIPLFLKYNLTITASSIEKVKQIDETAKKLNTKAKVHLKIDTGMERIGVHYYNAEKFLEAAHSLTEIYIEGIYSHFANSDDAESEYTKLQFERFKEVLKFYKKNKLKKPISHIANSGSILNFPEANLDLVRPGILLYGVYPSSKLKKNLDVKPVLSWKSRVVFFKVIKPGHPVGYGSTWQSEKNIRAVTVPVGYGDGYLRSLSHKTKVIIKDKIYPVIGTVSMDQIVVNIDQDSVYNNDEVILLGEDKTRSISCEELSDWASTIPYEILTNMNTRVPRIYIED
ncbi:MAG: alanine racemase [Ignavibacterium sp.]|nr:alanine racemase [Ignavibacterium sp.]